MRKLSTTCPLIHFTGREGIWIIGTGYLSCFGKYEKLKLPDCRSRLKKDGGKTEQNDFDPMKYFLNYVRSFWRKICPDQSETLGRVLSRQGFRMLLPLNIASG
jgi:hypothetical protein